MNDSPKPLPLVAEQVLYWCIPVMCCGLMLVNMQFNQHILADYERAIANHKNHYDTMLVYSQWRYHLNDTLDHARLPKSYGYHHLASYCATNMLHDPVILELCHNNTTTPLSYAQLLPYRERLEHQTTKARNGFEATRKHHHQTLLHFQQLSNTLSYVLVIMLVGFITHALLTRRKVVNLKANVDETSIALKQESERCELMAMASNDGFWDWDLVKNQVYYSPRWKEQLGYRDDPTANSLSTWAQLIVPEDKDRVLQQVMDYNEGRLTEFLSFQRYRHKNGQIIHILCRALHLKNSDGVPIRLIGTHTDLTDMLLEKQRAEAANKAKTQFLAHVSHEIRTPLNAIFGLTDLLMDTPITPQQKDYLGTLKFSGQTLLSIINDLLDLSKIEAGKLQIERIPFDLHQLLDNIYRLYQDVASQKGIQLNVVIDTHLPQWVLGDPTRLKQILANLVSNGIKFTNHGSVCLHAAVQTVTADQVQCLFSVKDTGIGIPADFLPHLFKPFTQLDASTTRQFGGSGLGLAIIQQLTQLLGGHIQVNSTINEGSTFTLALSYPLCEPATVAPLVTTDNQDLGGLRVLLVEDNPVTQKIMAKLLQNIGCRVSLANNGLEALTAVNVAQPDVILMDIQMPLLDGLEATRLIRQNSARLADRLPIIGLSAKALTHEQNQALAAGMDAFLTKPIDKPLLIQTLHQFAIKKTRLIPQSPG